MAVFHLQIVTPDRTCFDGMAERIIVRTLTGDVCIMAKHIDYTAPLAIGQALIINDKGEERYAACNSGLLSVSGGEVRIIATTFEWADEIDLKRAEAAKAKAEEALKGMQSDDQNFALMGAKLKRAIARLRSGE